MAVCDLARKVIEYCRNKTNRMLNRLKKRRQNKRGRSRCEIQTCCLSEMDYYKKSSNMANGYPFVCPLYTRRSRLVKKVSLESSLGSIPEEDYDEED